MEDTHTVEKRIIYVYLPLGKGIYLPLDSWGKGASSAQARQVWGTSGEGSVVREQGRARRLPGETEAQVLT